MSGLRKESIERIRYLEQKNGYLTPEMVLDDAMDKNSPLHVEFTWDESKAARAHWLDHARRLIRSVKVTFTTETMTVKTVAYVRDPSKQNNKQGYLSVENIRADEGMARDVLIAEFKRAGAALQRAQRLSLAFGIESQVEKMVETINMMRLNVEEYSLDS